VKYSTGDTVEFLGIEAKITEIEINEGFITFELNADELLDSQRVSMTTREFEEVEFVQNVRNEGEYSHENQVEQTVKINGGEE